MKNQNERLYNCSTIGQKSDLSVRGSMWKREYGLIPQATSAVQSIRIMNISSNHGSCSAIKNAKRCGMKALQRSIHILPIRHMEGCGTVRQTWKQANVSERSLEHSRHFSRQYFACLEISSAQRDWKNHASKCGI